MPKLTKLQATLIKNASTRADGALLPAPEAVSATDAALTRALAGLVKKGIARQRTMRGLDGETTVFFLTAAGRSVPGPNAGNPEAVPERAATPAQVRPGGKLGAVLKAVERKRGATLAELAETTGWQPHTTRAAFTRLRQRGFSAALADEDGRRAHRLQA